jgi:hypothetical protein
MYVHLTSHLKILLSTAYSETVKNLSLKNNFLTHLECNMFSMFPNLQKLDLDHNGMCSINNATFSGIPDLQRLSLSNNKLR